MPDQSEHERIENLVEAPGEAEQAARSLEDAASSHQTLQGFQAINNERIPEDLENEGLETRKKQAQAAIPRHQTRDKLQRT